MLNSFLFALNAVLPLVLMVAIGYFLKTVRLLNEDFAKVANKAVFRIFLPSMLFLNIYEIDLQTIRFDPTYLFYAVGLILAVFFLALFTVPLVTKDRSKFAPLMQAVFRSNNALIGVPLSEAIGGAEGVALASILIVVTVPLFNILAVILFSIYAENGSAPSIKKTLLEILKNPLIVSVAIGLLFLFLKQSFANVGVTTTLSDMVPIYKTLSYLKSIATPMALLMLGVQFRFSSVFAMKKELLYGVSARVLIVPAVSMVIACAWGIFQPAHMAAFIGIFATPVAVSTVPMAQELGGDHELAGQLVIWTTLLSGVTIFLFTFLLKRIGAL